MARFQLEVGPIPLHHQVYLDLQAALESGEFRSGDRLPTERERFAISWRYYIDAAQAWDQALELARAWTATYPREAFAFNSLGIASGAFGQHEQAVAAFREAIRLDVRLAPPQGNLVGSLIALDRRVRHAVRSQQGAMFLLTLSTPNSDAGPR